MKIKLRYETTGVDWEDVAQVIKQAPLGIRDPEKFRQACEKSYIVMESIKLLSTMW